ncbi:hypothetical protein TARUN_9736 [Trichoderma arundinaceum]|uniref:Uncharacterized protein n=1 Tax=Trichoderma arundinaceum TaxID=490622 RepID=A0A395N8S5_TRIAR|nr:hypothetical protein TARUN_9736 [Trichoderma arundinaceum]
MQLSQLAAFIALAAPTLASPLQDKAANAQCYENRDTAWWRPPGSLRTPPTVTIQDICSRGGVGGCEANYGRLCVLGDLNDCPSLIAAIGYYQRFTGDRWEFPSVVQCGNIAVSVAST